MAVRKTTASRRNTPNNNYQNHDIYYGTNSANALQPEYLPQRQPRRVKRIVKKPAKNTKSKIKPIISILVLFALFSLAVARFSMISQKNIEIQSLKSQFTAAQKQTNDLAMQAAMVDDLSKIKDEASTELGMKFADSDQIRFVDIPDSKAQNSTVVEEKQSLNIFDKFADWVFELGRRISA